MVGTRARPRRVLLSSTAAAASALVVGTCLLGAPPAGAAAGDWTRLSAPARGTDYPQVQAQDSLTVARFGTSVQVAWTEHATADTEALLTATVNGSGRVTRPARAILTGWSQLGLPRLISLHGERFLGFTGVRNQGSDRPYSVGSAYATTSPDGSRWSLGTGSLSASTSAWYAWGADLIDDAGTPVWAGTPPATGGIPGAQGLTWHVGLSDTIPAPPGSDGSLALGACCAYSTGLARDPVSGDVYAAFRSSSPLAAEFGVLVGRILPTPGPFTAAPESGLFDGSAYSTGDGVRVALAARPQGGVFLAYPVGYPEVRVVRLLDIASGTSRDITVTGDVRNVALSADPAGRLWLSWTQGTQLRVVHTNPAATALGSVRFWRPPPGTTDVRTAATSAGPRGLDVVLTASRGLQTAVWHTRVR